MAGPALHAIGFATAAAFSALLWHMQRKVDRATGVPSGYQVLWVVGIIWASGCFLRYMLELAGADAMSIRLAGMFAWSCTIIGSIAIGLFFQARMGKGNRISQRFVLFTGFVSILNLGLFVWAGATHAWDIGASWYPDTSLYVALVVTLIALVLYRLQRDVFRSQLKVASPHWLGRGMLVLAVIQVTAALLTTAGSLLPVQLLAVASIISEHWTIPWSILIAVSWAQVHYADVVLKRSLWLLACVSVAALTSAFILQTQDGWPLVVSTLGCATLMLGAPFMVRAVNSLVDRTLLNRRDYAVAAGELEQSIRRIYDQNELFEIASQRVASTLRVNARFVSASNDVPFMTRILASIPVEMQGQPSYWLEVSASHHARTLMQEELRFLNAVCTHVSRRLEAVHFEMEQRALSVREERLKRLLTEAELKALRTQVDPHFLFNTLNTIAELISSNPIQAEQMTERLAECFRYALSRHSRDLSTLDDELEFARHYLDIEQVRFGDRLRVQLSRGDATGAESVPSLLLQPLLENAIKHGLSPAREGGCVSVTAKREGTYLRLQVDDDGVGLRADFATRSGVGLRNVTERLATLYAQAAKLMIGGRADGRGTSVTILVPIHAD